MQREKDTREKVLEMLKDEYDLKSALVKLKETAEGLIPGAQFGGFTYRHYLASLQEICDICDEMLETISELEAKEDGR